ncbi:hypothetical protein JL100_015810 [Skermanella mucosa]|uniref:hypothetical protein n=1 Tax=Skermanella mucosa TaxID=1789672 RepID=UPI00192B5A3B|nr:hypothetical protein [Skermanella mucosa]UEM18583.1 hypothetical protein JL100_015810 [Skermanella mucosa]
MRAILLPALILVAASMQTTPAMAQTTGAQTMTDVTSAAKSAAKTLGSAAQDKLLVRDMLGAGVSGPGGKTVGTVEDLVAIPGGRIVAAIIATDAADMGRIPVPFTMVKVSRTAGKLGLDLPVGLSELKNMKEIQALAAATPGVK